MRHILSITDPDPDASRFLQVRLPREEGLVLKENHTPTEEKESAEQSEGHPRRWKSPFEELSGELKTTLENWRSDKNDGLVEGQANRK